MSVELELGVFHSGVAVKQETLDKFKDDQQFYLLPVLRELIRECQDIISHEGIYKFTLSVSKIK
jgi:hypothetical protein